MSKTGSTKVLGVGIAIALISCQIRAGSESSGAADQILDTQNEASRAARASREAGGLQKIGPQRIMPKPQPGMSHDQLLALNRPIQARSVRLEGDEYQALDLILDDGMVAECLMIDGKVERISTRSSLLRDEKNLGVGSHLSDLRGAYPSGDVIVGDDEGRYANFINGSNVVFELDTTVIGIDCFDGQRDPCELGSEIAVRSVVFHAGRASLEKPFYGTD